MSNLLVVDGKEIKPLNREQIVAECQKIKAKDIRNIVIVGVFSPLATSGTQEEQVRSLILDTLGSYKVNVVCSKDGN